MTGYITPSAPSAARPAGGYGKPLPIIDPLTEGFWEHARAGRLVVQRCERCGDLHIPPSPVCPKCLGAEQEWHRVSGRGTLMSYVVFHRAYWDGFASELPYNVGLVQLEEGPLLMTNIVHGEPTAESIGKAVRVVFDRATDELTLPKFELAAG